MLKNSLHKLNPDWQQAKRHAHASRTGKQVYGNSTSVINGEVLCDCCGEHIEKEPVNLWVHSKELEFLGFGFPLFYQFLKYCIILLIIFIGCYSAVSLEQAVFNNYEFCHQEKTPEHNPESNQVAHKCYTFLIQLARIEQFESSQQLTIRCVAFAVHMFVLLYIRNTIIKLEAYYDQRSTTLSDYSIYIKGISKKSQIRKSIMQFIQNEFPRKDLNIQQIILLPQFREISQMKKERQKIINKLRHFYDATPRQQESEQFLLQNQLNTINMNITIAANYAFSQIQIDKLACERAIVVFNTEQDKNYALEQCKDTSRETYIRYFGDEQKTYIVQGLNPEEIIWQNTNLPKSTRKWWKFLGWTLSLIVLAITFVIFYFILVAKSTLLEHAVQKLAENPDSEKYQNEYNGAVALIFFLMFLIVLFDKTVLAILFHKFTEMERNATIGKLQFSFALKLSLGLFFTTALMTLAVEAIKFQNYFTHPYGVIDEQTIMFFMNSFFVPFFWLVNPIRLIKILKRKWHYGKKNLTQEQANKLMEQDSYDLGKRFAEVIEIMWFVFLYSTLLPIGAVLSVIGLSFYYWVDKYNLLRRSRVHGQVQGTFIKTSLTLLDFTLILKPVGSLIFDLHIRGNSYLVSNIVMICVAFVYIIFPKNYLIQLLNQEFFRPESKTYEQVKGKFKKNFHTEHPLFNVLDINYSKRQITQRRLQQLNSLPESSKTLSYFQPQSQSLYI